MLASSFFFFFFFNDTATTEIYTLSLHDALPILVVHPAREPHNSLLIGDGGLAQIHRAPIREGQRQTDGREAFVRSEEHTSELQSRLHLVCRLLLEKKKQKSTHVHTNQTTSHNYT